MSKDIENTEKKDTDITQFISNVKKYTEITQLSAEILNELIEKILIILPFAVVVFISSLAQSK